MLFNEIIAVQYQTSFFSSPHCIAYQILIIPLAVQFDLFYFVKWFTSSVLIDLSEWLSFMGINPSICLIKSGPQHTEVEQGQ